MSMLPLLVDIIDDTEEDTWGLGNYPAHYGMGMYQRDINPRPLLRRQANVAPWPNFYTHPWIAPRAPQFKRSLSQTMPTSILGKDVFKASLDVADFPLEEITVKTCENENGNTIVVEGKHEEKEDEHGHVYRHFIRRYHLPKNYDTACITAKVSSDGILTIKAPPQNHVSQENERIIQVQATGPSKLQSKDSIDVVQCTNY